MLCADRRIDPRDVLVISGYPGTENLVKQIKEAGLEKAQYLMLRHPKLLRKQLEQVLRERENKVKVIFCDECLIPNMTNNMDFEMMERWEYDEKKGGVAVDLMDILDWGWLAGIENTTCDLVICLKPHSREPEIVKLPYDPRIISQFLPTPHRQGFQPGCMTLFYNYFVDNVLGYKIDCRWDEVGVLLKLENERKLPESKPLLWLDIKERDWGPGKVLQKLRDAGVSVDMGGTGLFLCPHNELSKAKRQMPANWKALHQDAMHGLEAEVAHYFHCNLHDSFISGGRCCWGPGFTKGTVESGPEASGSGDKQ